TKTRLLGPGSSAIDLVPSSGSDCPTTDQRGVTRAGHGTGCDAGAYEVVGPAATTGPVGSITEKTAKVEGTVTPNGPITSYRVQFGKTTAYGSFSQTATVGPGLGGAVPIVVPLAGLQAK